MNPLDKEVYEKIARIEGEINKTQKVYVGKIGEFGGDFPCGRPDIWTDDKGYYINEFIGLENEYYPILLSDVLNYINGGQVTVFNEEAAIERLTRNHSSICWNDKPTYEEQSEELKDFVRSLLIP